MYIYGCLCANIDCAICIQKSLLIVIAAWCEIFAEKTFIILLDECSISKHISFSCGLLCGAYRL